MRCLGTFLVGATLVAGCGKSTKPVTSSGGTPPPRAAAKNAEAMRGLREMMLTTPAAKLGIQKTDDFPRTYGVLMDWPIGSGRIASVVGLCDGNASLYTTGSFGVIGGIGHETVRRAAMQFVKTADKFYSNSIPTSEYPYPNAGQVKFYLVTHNGVRVIDSDLNSIASGGDKLSELFKDGQRLITELRLVTEKKAP